MFIGVDGEEADLGGAGAVKIQKSWMRERFERDSEVRKEKPCVSMAERSLRTWARESVSNVDCSNTMRIVCQVESRRR